MKSYVSVVLGVMGLSLAACDFGPNSGEGFSLPEGNVDAGRQVFLDMGCNACHSIGDIEQLPADGVDIPSVKLGGSVGRVKTYGNLVTSVINPSHRILRRYGNSEVTTEDGQSKMLNYNSVLTVAQLVDLVTFLDTNYDLVTYQRSRYPIYGP